MKFPPCTAPCGQTRSHPASKAPQPLRQQTGNATSPTWLPALPQMQNAFATQQRSMQRQHYALALPATQVSGSQAGVMQAKFRMPPETAAPGLPAFTGGSDLIQGKFSRPMLNQVAILPQFCAIAGAMRVYNLTLGKARKGVHEYRVLAHSLQTIDREIYDYTTEQSETFEELLQIPHFALLDDIRRQAELEHQDFVEMALTNGKVPIDIDHMPKENVIPTLALWYAISSGRSKIKLTGTAAEKKQAMSWLVKILETPTGVKLLDYLNSGDIDDEMTHTYIGQRLDDLPQNVVTNARLGNNNLSDGNVSMAQPLGRHADLDGPHPLTMNEAMDDYVVANSPADVNKALLGNKAGIIIGGDKYLYNRNKGVGAFVTIAPGAGRHENRRHHQILNPAWVTLGHELGHATHMRAGGTDLHDAPRTDPDPGSQETSIMIRLGKGAPEKMHQQWQNGEEFLNINTWENFLRTDAGLAMRASHIPFKAGKALERLMSITLEIKEKATRHGFRYRQMPEVASLLKDLNLAYSIRNTQPTASLLDDNVYNNLQQRWHVLRTKDFTQDIFDVTGDELKEKMIKLERTYRIKLNAYNSKKLKSTELKVQWADLNQRYNIVFQDVEAFFRFKLKRNPQEVIKEADSLEFEMHYFMHSKNKNNIKKATTMASVFSKNKD